MEVPVLHKCLLYQGNEMKNSIMQKRKMSILPCSLMRKTRGSTRNSCLVSPASSGNFKVLVSLSRRHGFILGLPLFRCGVGSIYRTL